jgi:type I restriction enzyme R subunit
VTDANKDLNMVLQQDKGSYAGGSDQNDQAAYQSEDQLEQQLISILTSQGYQYVDGIKNEADMKLNLRTQMEYLNQNKLALRSDDGPKDAFTDLEWERFFNEIIANKAEGLLEKTRKLRESQVFKMDDGVQRNFRLISADPSENVFQVVNQIERDQGRNKNRYDVTLLVNGLPLVHTELKRRGVRLREAFNQVNRYRRDSFWSESGLFNYVQIFVISNGTMTRYYSNTVRELSRKNQDGRTATQKKTFAYQFASHWADKNNLAVTELPDFARTFLEYRQLTNILCRYCVLGTDDIMRVLRPYQVHAVEAIERRVLISADKPGSPQAGGYIWHTTGSGKTLTSFVAATLLSKQSEIDKVLFVVDRKDLDYQTMLEFNKFSEGSVDGTNNTKQLGKQLHSADDKIIVTTIQKLDRYTRKNMTSDLKQKRVVLIFDECHRSQFGVFHENITKFFSKYHMFGFTGTPIFAKNASRSSSAVVKASEGNQFGTTEAVFGDKLHYYTIVSAINDKNVLPFKVDYVNTVRSKEGVNDKDVTSINKAEALESQQRIQEIVTYIIEHHDSKTRQRRFNALLATSSVKVAQKYYREFERQQKALTEPESDDYNPDFKPLKIATIYSYSPNDDDGSSDGDINSIDDEALESTEGLSTAARDQLDLAISDYNQLFQTNYDAGNNFADYYKDLSKRMKSYKDDQGDDVSFAIDILIVVNMFLTGFDAPTLNTIYVDKNLQLHGLLQAFSRTNRILNDEKSHGEILCFRNLSEQVDQSISLFGDEGAAGVVLLKPYHEYLDQYRDLLEKLNDLGEMQDIVSEQDKKSFIQIWSNILKQHNILKTFDQYAIEPSRLSERQIQDNNSYYLELKDQFTNDITGESILDDVVFETELVKSVEVNIDYILDLIHRYHAANSQDTKIYEQIMGSLSASPTLRHKKELIEKFIAQLNQQQDVENQFADFISQEAARELEEIVTIHDLDMKKTRKLINSSFRDGQLPSGGTSLTDLNSGKAVAFGPQRNQWKQKLFQVLSMYFEKYVDLTEKV